MKTSMLKTLMLCALFVATVSKADNASMSGHTDRKDDSMQGCRDMMTGMQMRGSGMAGGMGMMQGRGGMMGNMNSAKPNEQWRNPAQQPQPDTPDRKP